MLDDRLTVDTRDRQPRVSIGLPVYNGQRFVAQAVESLLAQTFTDFELILCDNASTDATESICRAFAARDGRVRYVRNRRNLGAAPNFNRAFSLSRGRYFKWVAHDDVYAPTYLERCVGVLDRDPAVVLCHSRTAVIDNDGRRVPVVPGPNPRAPSFRANGNGRAYHGNGQPVGSLTWEDLYDPPRRLGAADVAERLRAVLVETNWCFEIFGLMRTAAARRSPLHRSFYGSDKVMLVSMALAGPFAEVPEELFFRRFHPGQSSSKTNGEQRVWIDTTQSGRPLPPPQVQCLAWYLRLIGEAPLDSWDRLRCAAEVGRWALWLSRLIYRDRHQRGFLHRLGHSVRAAVGT